MYKTFPKGDKDNRDEHRLPSYEDNSFPWDFCRSNQKITNIECGDSINRRVMDRDITEIRYVLVPVRTWYGQLTGREWRLQETKIGTERIVVHDEN